MPSSHGYFLSKDRTQLYIYYDLVENAKACILYVHGFAEHSQRYKSALEFFRNAFFSQFFFDNRGHGKSGGKRGYINSFSEYLEDLKNVVSLLKSISPATPIFLLGHSLGGLIAFLYGIKEPESISAIILSSPAFGFKVKVSKIKKFIAKFFNYIFPSLPLKSGIEPSFLSHDENVVRDYENDKLIFKSATPRWYVQCLKAQKTAKENSSKFSLPVLFLQAGDDKLVDVNEAVEIFKKIASKHKKIKIYEGMYHEILNEINRKEVLEDILLWLNEKVR